MDSIRTHLKEYLLFYLMIQAAITLPGARLVLLSYNFENAALFTSRDYYTLFIGTPYFFALMMLPAIACVLKELGRFGILKQLFVKIGLVSLGGFLYIFFGSKYYMLISMIAIVFSIGLVAFWAAAYFTITPTGFLNTISARRTRAFNGKALVFALLLIGSFTAIEFVLPYFIPQPPELKYSALEWVAKEKAFFEWKAAFSVAYALIMAALFVSWFFAYRASILCDMKKFASNTGNQLKL